MAKKSNTNMILLAVGGLAVVYIVTRPKPAPIVPYGSPGYLPPSTATSPITSLINLLKGGGGSSQSSSPGSSGQSYFTDASGNIVDQNGNIVSQAYSGSSGGGYTPSGSSGDITSSGTSDISAGSAPDPTIDEMNLYD